MNQATPKNSNVEKYKPFLCRIGIKMGINEIESGELSDEVVRSIARERKIYKNINPLRIRLSQLMVKKCFYKMSCRLFNDTDLKGNIKPPTPRNIPISLWIVFILYTSIGFSEQEIAEILSTTPAKIKDKLTRAKAILITNKS